ncbi:MAG: glycosyltransferase family 2 protein [Acidimicrobiia bacterium]|jgi:dolichol-phosphate mannosyltransferase|nr:glycosyltransferase family 2 protein [Acidimicrobiia bacterium]MBP8179452.1 glycosyltransferase family 2 protein [Acidimicrobiia bacterium]
MSAQQRTESITTILPSYNEAENLPEVIDELTGNLDELFTTWSILIVDDGSTDNTREVVAALSQKDSRISILSFRRNRGKSAALQAAFDVVDSDLVLLMDADGQDDPKALPSLLEQIDNGFDLVTGQRETRNDRTVKRTTSKVYNYATRKATGVDGKDFNSGYKLMRGDVMENISMYGELHRYIPILASWSGFKVTEVPVNHRERAHGTTKFGINRFWRGMLDLFTVKFLTTYDRRPFHLVGAAGIVLVAIGGALLAWMLALLIGGVGVGNRPALLAGVMFVVVGVQLICVGLIAELIVHLDMQRRLEDQRMIRGARSLDV